MPYASRVNRMMAEQSHGNSRPTQVSAAYQMLQCDTVVFANASGSSYTIILPSVADAPGVPFTIRITARVAPFFVKVVDQGDTGDGVDVVLDEKFQAVTFTSNGVEWIMGEDEP